MESCGIADIQTIWQFISDGQTGMIQKSLAMHEYTH